MELNTQVEFSVIILCYRSEEAILQFARTTRDLVKGLTDSYEIVLVGNYFENSGDNTREYIAKLEKEDAHFRGICKPKEGMMGWDMREGLNFAKGKYLCIIDGDGQFPIDSISACYKEIKKGKYGLVKTYREKRGDGIYRQTISKVYNFLFSLLFPNVKARDINSKPKVLTKECYDQLNLTSDDWFVDAEIMINIGKLGIPTYEFPVVFEKLKGRESFVKPKAIIEFIRNLIKHRFG
jgi:glycosyltransferase involved in cell wall biosynthesis